MDELEMIRELILKDREREEKVEPTIEELETMAKNGDADAAFVLARTYRMRNCKEQNGVERDEDKSDYFKQMGVDILAKEAERGNGIAAYNISERYRQHYYGKSDIEKAAKWAKMAEPLLIEQAKTNAEAKRLLGQFYCRGVGEYIAPQIEKAIALWQEAADSGDADAMNEIAYIYFYYGKGAYEGDDENAYVWFKKAANASSTKAMCSMAEKYFSYDDERKLTGKDVKKAIAWLTMAADAGDAHAMKKLGDIYHDGCRASKIRKDYTKSAFWYSQVAKSTDGNKYQAIKGLAYCYINGSGVVRDYHKAFKLFEALEEYSPGHAFSGMLGYMYSTGKGVEKDYEKALFWTLKGADDGKGAAFAINNLGCLYEAGQGVIKDVKKAIELYKIAASKGDKLSEKSLLSLIKRGKLSKKDYFEFLVSDGVEKLNEFDEIADRKKAESQIKRECDLIEKHDLYDYFLAWRDIVRLANENNIRIGAGRGAAVSSAVCYALGITKVDPTKYGLQSGLFLSDEHHSPNISIDVSCKRRDWLLKCIVKKYGGDKVAKISAYKKDTKEIAGVHQHSIVISDLPLAEAMPTKMTEDGLVVLLDRTDCKAAGLKVYEILGLKALNVVDDTLELIRNKHGTTVYIDGTEGKYKAVDDMISMGETEGVFMLESKKIRESLSKLKPQNIEELAGILAVHRANDQDEIQQFISTREYPKNLENIKAHYVAHAIMAYQAAYLKCNYPKEYLTTYKKIMED